MNEPVRFWQGMEKATTINLLDKVMIGRNVDGSSKYADLNMLLALMSTTGVVAFKGLATTTINPGVPSGIVFYDATPGETYPNFRNQSGDPITIPLKVGEKNVYNSKLIYSGSYWMLTYDLFDIGNQSFRWSFNVGLPNYVQVRETDGINNGYIKISGSVLVINPSGGFYHLGECVINFNEGDLVYLSKSADSYVALDSVSSGDLGNVFLMTGSLDTNRYDEKIIIGSCYAGTWSSIFSAFSLEEQLETKLRISPDYTNFVSSTVIYYNSNLIEISTDIEVLNPLGTRLLLKSENYIIPPKSVVVLSKSKTSYIEVQKNESSNTPVYLWWFNYDANASIRFRNVIGVVSDGGLLITDYPVFYGNELLNKDKFKRTNWFKKASHYYAWGDSQTRGFGCVDPNYQCYSAQLNNEFRKVFTKKAIDGAGTREQTEKFVNESVAFNDFAINTVMLGFNDVRYASPADYPDPRANDYSVGVINYVIGCLRSMIAWNYLKTAVSATFVNPPGYYFSRTLSGAWSGRFMDRTTFAYRLSNSNQVMTSSEVGAKINFRINDLAKYAVVGYFISSSLEDAGVLSFQVNGIEYKRINTFSTVPNGGVSAAPTWDVLKIPLPFAPLMGDSEGGNLITIEVISGVAMIDYVGILKTRSYQQMPFILSTIVRMPDGYYNNDMTTLESQNHLNSQIFELADEWKEFKVAVAESNKYYDPNDPTQVYEDHIHVNEKGHIKLKDGFLQIINTIY